MISNDNSCNFCNLFLIFSIDATFSEKKGRFVNDAESFKANARMRLINVDEQPVLALFAKRRTNTEEEIRFDYGVKNLPWRQKRGMVKYILIYPSPRSQ